MFTPRTERQKTEIEVAMEKIVAGFKTIRKGDYLWGVDMGAERGSRNDAPAPTRNADGTWNFTVSTESYCEGGGDRVEFGEGERGVAALFQTKSIDWGKEERSSGYCSSCYNEWDALAITLKNATLPELP